MKKYKCEKCGKKTMEIIRKEKGDKIEITIKCEKCGLKETLSREKFHPRLDIEWPPEIEKKLKKKKSRRAEPRKGQ